MSSIPRVRDTFVQAILQQLPARQQRSQIHTPQATAATPSVSEVDFTTLQIESLKMPNAYLHTGNLLYCSYINIYIHTYVHTYMHTNIVLIECICLHF